MAPRVSILINNYNYGRYLGRAIDSALGQRYDSLEVVVVDDGSQDASASVLDAYEDAATVIRKANGGQASAFNAGFAASGGDILCFLDADDYFYPRKVAAVVEAFQRQPLAGWLFHALNYVDADAQPLAVQDPSQQVASGLVDFRDTFRRGSRFTHAIPCGLCFRREVLARILPMPEAQGVTISDNYVKYAALGLSPGYFLAEALAVQRIHGSNTYTFQQNARLRAEINIKTGYHLRQRHPHMAAFADKIFTRGCGEMLAETSLPALGQIPEVRAYLKRYGTPTFLAKYLPKAGLQWLRYALSR